MAAKKPKSEVKSLDEEVFSGEVDPAEETVITTPRGAAVGIALRVSETETEFRALLTIRFGYAPEKITFNFGNYGGGTVKGGGDGSEPPTCP